MADLQPTNIPTAPQTDPKQALLAFGLDPAQVDALSPDQLQVLGMMANVMTVYADQNKAIAPASTSQADMDAWLKQAKDFVDPYYQQNFDMNATALKFNLAQMTGEAVDVATAQAQAFGAQSKQLQDQMRQAGLERSGLQKKAEEQLKTQQEGLVRSDRRKLQQNIQALGQQAEQLYGVQGFNALGVPQVTSPGYAGLGIGSENVAYAPSGIQAGSEVQNRTLAESSKQNELANQALLKKNFLTGFTKS